MTTSFPDHKSFLRAILPLDWDSYIFSDTAYDNEYYLRYNRIGGQAYLSTEKLKLNFNNKVVLISNIHYFVKMKLTVIDTNDYYQVYLLMI